MRILHLMAGELTSGAGKGAYLLHKSLCERGIDSILVCSGRNSPDDNSVLALSSNSKLNRFRFSLTNLIGNLPLFLYTNRLPRIFNTGFAGIDVTSLPCYQTADIIHLHWINGLVPISVLRSIKKPVVWTLRDMWPLTGGCHYSIDCDKFKTGCGFCPQLQSKQRYDLSALVGFLKRLWLPSNLKIIGISRWLTDLASSSSVFSDHSCTTISNNIDTDCFKPFDKFAARKFLDLPTEKKIILIGAQNVTDFYKGFDLFLQSLDYIQLDSIHIVTFGRAAETAMKSLHVAQTHFGFLSDEMSLRLLYCSADLFVAPSRMDAFGKTLAESLACSLPVVCFNSSGPADIVDHRITGYLAEPFDPADLAFGINWILQLTSPQLSDMKLKCRNSAVKKFDSRVIARKYIDLYHHILGA